MESFGWVVVLVVGAVVLASVGALVCGAGFWVLGEKDDMGHDHSLGKLFAVGVVTMVVVLVNLFLIVQFIKWAWTFTEPY